MLITLLKLGGIAIAFLPIALVVLLWLVRNARKGGRGIWTLLIWTLGLGPAITVVLAPVALDATGSASDPTVVWPQRMQSLLVLFLLLVALVYVVTRRGSQPEKRSGPTGFPLLIGALGFALGPILASAFGQQPHFLYGQLFVPILFTTVALLPPLAPDWFAYQVKNVLLVYIYGSLLLALATPAMAFGEASYAGGLLPGPNVRLQGLTTHPNGLASLAILYLILSRQWPHRNPFNLVHLLSTLIVLVLAQSKTIWVIAVLLFFITHPVWLRRTVKHQIAKVFSVLLVSLVGLAVFAQSPTAFLSRNQWDSALSLTGRTSLWAETLRIWGQNPLFGYGPTLWNLDQRLTLGYTWAGQAHNQVIQTLGESGLIGLALLILYLWVLLRTGWNAVRRNETAPISLVILLTLRGITESPLRNYNLDPGLFVYFVTFSVLFLAQRAADKPRELAKKETWGPLQGEPNQTLAVSDANVKGAKLT